MINIILTRYFDQSARRDILSENTVFSGVMTGERRGHELDVLASRGLSSPERCQAFT